METAAELKRAGLKRTSPRLRVLQLFKESAQRHVSAEEVYQILLQERADIGFSTVYRVLSQLEQAHLIVSHRFDGARTLYELNEGDHHDHLVCVECGVVDEFSDVSIKRRQRDVARAKGFSLREHSMVLSGKCAQCQRRASE